MFEQEIVLSSQASTAIHHTYPSHVTLCRSKDKTEAVVWQVFLAASQALSDFSPQMAVVSALPTWRNPQRSAGINTIACISSAWGMEVTTRTKQNLCMEKVFELTEIMPSCHICPDAYLLLQHESGGQQQWGIFHRRLQVYWLSCWMKSNHD